MNPFGSITDVDGVLVGQTERIGDGWLSGVTVILPPEGTIGAVDVRGGGPGTHETDVLAPGTVTDLVHAVTLSGGSSFGLAAATGVQRWCEEQRRGLEIRPGVFVPINPSAIVFDLERGGDPTARPDAEMGHEAASRAAGGEVRTGVVGAGTGTTFSLAQLKAGVGTASIGLPGGVVVGALAVGNAAGSPCVPGSAALLAAPLVTDPALRPRTPDPDEDAVRPADPFAGGGNTTLAVVATNAVLDHGQTSRMALSGHDGLARAIRPAHTLVDGDAIFGLSTRQVPAENAASGLWPDAALEGVAAIQAAAADAVTLAIVDCILAATGVATPGLVMRSYLERYPSATPQGF